MKKQNIVVIILGLLILTTYILITFVFKGESKIYLKEDYYNNASIIEIDNAKLKELENSKESFIVFIYQPLCASSNSFESIIKDFSEKEKITMYKIMFSTIEGTQMDSCLKYYPSVTIYEEGKVKKYLDSDKAEDLKYYETYSGFKSWINKYVYLK